MNGECSSSSSSCSKQGAADVCKWMRSQGRNPHTLTRYGNGGILTSQLREEESEVAPSVCELRLSWEAAGDGGLVADKKKTRQCYNTS